MNPSLNKLCAIANKKERRIIGLMSGTSLDGLDIALCRVEGSGPNTNLQLEKFITEEYSETFRQKIRDVFAKKTIQLEDLCQLNVIIAQTHAQLINKTLEKWSVSPNDIDCIASHGQTVYHAPMFGRQTDAHPNSTLQIGDGDHIAVATGIITLSDFRQKHVAAGGEGAPLAAYGDVLLFSSMDEHRILLNIGGISNFTLVPKINSSLKAYATDVGPGNTMMNQYMKKMLDIEMDQDASLASTGTINNALLGALVNHPFFKQNFPKTTGPELFNLDYLLDKMEEANVSNISHADIMSTLCAFSAEAIGQAIKRATQSLENVCIYLSGGGIHNPLLVNLLEKSLDKFELKSFEKIGFDPDAKEACLFAVLANETIAGNPKQMISLENSPQICMGKISLPD